MPDAEALRTTPNALAGHYARFRVTERVLLTGHSHQAWPDVAFEAQAQAWSDAAECVDEKWERAFEKADRVRRGFARLLDDPPENVVLGQNTHELVVRFLSALPLQRRPRLVTTKGEFHTIRRQLDRLAEDGLVELVKVDAEAAETIAERLIAEVDERTAAVLVSSVLFGNARIVSGLDGVAGACRKVGAELLVDAYHHLNVVPFSIAAQSLETAFVVGGGYKYCQLGEGNCFLRVPPGREDLRPVLTGWFSEFAMLTDRPSGHVPYGEGPARWAGATYDPVSHYRAARVFEFFEEQGLDAGFLRKVSRHQVGLLASAFDALDADPRVVRRDRDVPLGEIGGFLALRAPRAASLCRALRERGIHSDVRGDVLRLGPAPYLSDAQITDAVLALGACAAAGGS